jgi:hypothetical protein
MIDPRIDTRTGEFAIDDVFIASATTTLTDLTAHFGDGALTKSKYVKELHSLPKMHIESLYFRFSFGFVSGRLMQIYFEIDESPEPRAAWSNNRDLETKWIAEQTNDATGFDWNNNPDCEHYRRTYDWGGVGIFFDFKNGTYQSSLRYRH